MKLTIIIPLAGNRTFKMEKGSEFPKILSELNGKLLLERAAAPLLDLPFELNIVVVIPEAQIKKYNLDKVLSALDSRITVLPIEGETKGASCTTLLAIDEVSDDSSLIITSFEQILDLQLAPLIKNFIEGKVDCGVLTFDSIHPRFSYVLCDDNANILQAAEKKPISRSAVAGLYYFSSAGQFFEAAKNTILYGGIESGYYISNSINEYVLNGKTVKAQKIPKEKYFHFYDTHNVEQYETSKVGEVINSSLLVLTREYVKAFDSMDLTAIESFFAPDFTLTDPAVSIIGKDRVVNYIKEIFEGCASLSFRAISIFVDGKNSVIEFELYIDDAHFIGTDVISWNNADKMQSMAAYLYEKKNGC